MANGENVRCVECGKLNVTPAAAAYCAKIEFGPHCHACQQKKGLNRYEVASKVRIETVHRTVTVHDEEASNTHALEVIGWIYNRKAYNNATYLEKTVCGFGKNVSPEVWVKAQAAIAHARKMQNH